MSFVNKHPYPTVLAGCIVALGLFMTLTNPEQVAVAVLVIPVVLIFFMVFSFMQIVFGRSKRMKRANRKARVISIVTASLVTVIMILRSTGGLSTADLIILGLIILVAAIYIDKY